MADILIRGMEMPKDEPLRIYLYANGQVHVDRGVYYDEYEAVELPEHGDLIDRDEIIEQIAETPFTMSMFLTVKECRAAINAKEVIHNVVAYATAVIPSNKEETE